MAKRTVVAAVGQDDEVVFTNTVVYQSGANIEQYHHTVTVADDCDTFSVDIQVGGRWIRPDSCTDVAASDGAGKANAVVLRQIGYDAVRVTCAEAGNVTLTHWKDV
jgi:hypothetical protein